MKPQTRVYVPVSEIFPGTQTDFHTFRAILESLSRDDTLLWCGRLNTVVSGFSDLDHVSRQQFGVSYFFRTERLHSLNRFVSVRPNPDRIGVFFRGQLLELIRWVSLVCQNHPEDGTTFEDPATRELFLKAALIASEIWGRRVYADRLNTHGTLTERLVRALGALRKGVEGGVPASDLARTLGRGWVLFGECLRNRYPSFEQEFEESTGFSVEDYYVCLAAILSNYVMPETDRYIFPINSFAANTGFRDKLPAFVIRESQTAEELRTALWGSPEPAINSFEDAPPYNYRPLRERSLFRTPDGRCAILDPVFLCERALIGPLFSVALGQTPPDANKLFTAFGQSFEQYCQDTLRRMFPDRPGLTRRLHCSFQVDQRAEVDACLNDVTEIVVIEAKAVWIREDEILAKGVEAFASHVLEKYGVTTEPSSARKVKGIGQLARAIEAMASDDWLKRNPEFASARLIYPILLVHDVLLGGTYVGGFLMTEFRKLLAAPMSDQDPTIGRFRIAPLIVMTVDDLENLESSLDRFGFRELLADYVNACKDGWVPLQDFIALSRYKDLILYNRHLASKGIEVLHKASTILDPGVAPDGP